MEQFRKFLQGRGYVLVLTACLLAAAAAGVWAVQTVRGELQRDMDALRSPGSTARAADEGAEQITLDEEEGSTWKQDTAPAANSVANVPQTAPSASSSASGASSGSGTVREPSELRTGSAPASSSALPASMQPVSGRILNGFSGTELVYNKTLGDWRTHNGTDYAAAEGSEVRAPAAGSVTQAGTDGNWGGVVSVEDAQGRIWRVCGVTQAQVRQGDTVTAGQILGTVGSVNCECAEESHIHLEVLDNGNYCDPAGALS